MVEGTVPIEKLQALERLLAVISEDDPVREGAEDELTTLLRDLPAPVAELVNERRKTLDQLKRLGLDLEGDR